MPKGCASSSIWRNGVPIPCSCRARNELTAYCRGRLRKRRIHGVLSCFDRMLFRGYLPIHVWLGDGPIPRWFRCEW